MSHISTDTRWMSEGNCAEKDPAIFFPSDGVGVEKAKRICNGCGFQNQCLEYALINRVEHGVWGGASEPAKADSESATTISFNRDQRQSFLTTGRDYSSSFELSERLGSFSLSPSLNSF